MPITIELPGDELKLEFDDSYSSQQIADFISSAPWRGEAEDTQKLLLEPLQRQAQLEEANRAMMSGDNAFVTGLAEKFYPEVAGAPKPLDLLVGAATIPSRVFSEAAEPLLQPVAKGLGYATIPFRMAAGQPPLIAAGLSQGPLIPEPEDQDTFLGRMQQRASEFSTPGAMASALPLVLAPEATIPAGIAFGAPMALGGVREINQGKVGPGIADLFLGGTMAGLPLLTREGARNAIQPENTQLHGGMRPWYEAEPTGAEMPAEGYGTEAGVRGRQGQALAEETQVSLTPVEEAPAPRPTPPEVAKAEPLLDFGDFSKAEKESQPTLQEGQVAESFEQNLWRELFNASKYFLEEQRKALGLEKTLGSTEIADNPKASGEAGRYRTKVITEIGVRMMRDAEEKMRLLTTKEVTPEDIRVSGGKAFSGFESLAPDIDRATLEAAFTDDASAFKGWTDAARQKGGLAKRYPESVTKRLAVLENKKTGAIEMVSSYPAGRGGVKVRDPEGTKHTKLDAILERYRPIYSVLLDKPVKNFRQSFENIEDFNAKFGDEAKRLVSEEHPTSEAPAETVESAAVPSAEFANIRQHIQNAIGQLESPEDAARGIEGITLEDRNIIAGLRRMSEEIERETPGLDDGQWMRALSEKIYEQEQAAQKYEGFLRRGLEPHRQEGRQISAPAARQRRGEAAFGIVPPTAVKIAEWIKGIPRSVRIIRSQLAGQSAPRTSEASVESGNKLVGFAASDIAALEVAKYMATYVLGPHYRDASFGKKLGAVLVEDRLRSIKDRFEKAGDATAAGNVTTIIGAKYSPLKTEADFQTALTDPEIQAAIARHKETVEAMARLYHKQAGGKLAGAGLNTGAFVNLKAILEGIEPEILGRIARGNLENPLLKKTRFFKQAKGTAEWYELDYRTIAERMVKANFTEYAKRQMYAQLIHDGLAILKNPGEPMPEIGGKKSVKFTIERKGVPAGGNRARTYIRNLWVREDIAPELRQAEDVDGPIQRAGLVEAASLMNKIQLAGPTDAVWHIANMVGSIAGSQGGRTLLADIARKLPGLNIVDALARVGASAIRVLRDAPDIQRQIADLAQIGAMRAPGKSIGHFNNRLIMLLDRAGRLVRDDLYQNLVRRGLVDDSLATRREFVNQMGNYNPRLMGQFERIFREAGFSPFIVAGRNFNRMAWRRLTLDPGIKAASPTAWAQMRGIEALGMIATLVAVPSLFNLLTVGNPAGRKGVKFGQIDTGVTRDDGTYLVIDPAQWVGLRRGIRISGLGSLAEGIRRGESKGRISHNMIRDLLGGIIHPWAGPTVRTGSVAVTGYDPSGYKESTNPYDYGENAKAALKQLNPVAQAILTAHEKDTKPLSEIGLSFGGAAGVKAVKPLTARSELMARTDAMLEKSPDPKLKELYRVRQERSLAENKYNPMLDALKKNDLGKARTEYEALKKVTSSVAIYDRMNPWAQVRSGAARAFVPKAFVDIQVDAKMRKENRELYNAAVKEREDLFRRFQQMLREAPKK